MLLLSPDAGGASDPTTTPLPAAAPELPVVSATGATNNVFFNIGYLQRSPLVANVFVNNNNAINPNAVPEKLFSYELGYGFRSADLTANVNVYRSTYKDRSVAPRTELNSDGTISTVSLTGINELHQGIEFDARYRPSRDVTFRGTLSLAQWTYLSNAGPAFVFDDSGKFSAGYSELQIKGLHVGDAAQTTGSFGFDINILPKLKVGPVINYYANYTANFFPENITATGYTPYKVPNYTLYDFNSVFRFKFAGLDGSFIANVHNLFDTAYISDARDASGISNTTNTIGVYFGTGRTYTTSLRIRF
jgi:outer membrane receptor protein involved in Fe transport